MENVHFSSQLAEKYQKIYFRLYACPDPEQVRVFMRTSPTGRRENNHFSEIGSFCAAEFPTNTDGAMFAERFLAGRDSSLV